jgi:thiamine-phosphate pyrophosphorylase
MLQHPLLYLITRGQTTARTTPATEDFASVLRVVQAAVTAGVDLVQIREKNLNASVLYQLSAKATALTRGSATRLLINDRADIAAATGADGVHLTTSSLPTDVVRRTFGDDFLIGVSTHSLAEGGYARLGGADFVVLGPIFETASKREYGEPLGLGLLEKACAELAPFPVLALGGLTLSNVTPCIRAGAQGIAAIRMLNDPHQLENVVSEIREEFEKAQNRAGAKGLD